MDATEQSLLRAICENPAEDAPRLVYADWLDEEAATKGKPTPCPRAAYIRAKILGGVPIRGLGPWPSWAGPLQKVGDGLSRTWSRGFVERVRCSLAAWLKHGKVIVRAHPVTEVRLMDRVPDWDDGLFQWVSASSGTDGWRFDIHFDCLPWSVFERLDGWVRERIELSFLTTAGRYYRTEAEARAALSAAAIAWARAA